MDKLEKLLESANARLKKSNAGITIFRRGQKLSLRGMLPPKPGKSKPSQQTIKLDIYCNGAGIKSAEKQAQQLSSSLALNQFTWDDWIEQQQSISSVGDYIRRFEQDYFERRADNSRSRTTWNGDYKAMFDRLPMNERLCDRVLVDLVLSTEPDSRQRKRAVMVANALASFAELNERYDRYKGTYSHIMGNRTLPSDRDITLQYWSIKNPKWQYVYGLMAAYGISNHEVFLVDLNSLQQSPGHLVSSYRKAHYGQRRIWCLYPEWWKEWELYKPKSLPNVSGKTNRELGARVTAAFSRYGVCKPGDLRHCWAIRAMGFMPNPMAARMMAHSEVEHNRTYQRWMNCEQEDRFYQLLMSRSDRPVPPN